MGQNSKSRKRSLSHNLQSRFSGSFCGSLVMAFERKCSHDITMDDFCANCIHVAFISPPFKRQTFTAL